ncbi:PD-(D/E)XK nuclease family protein [Candidatus Woesearchaeota archaeon]|nr:PD-(D/E)XK nuclease family protein [Candidatus Woesearchaeota archaeon]
MFEDCPDHYFVNGPRASKLKTEIKTNIVENEGQEVSILAKEALNWAAYKTAHSNVQVFMLKFDNNTIGVEVPIWGMPEEIDEFGSLSKHPLTGHIDVLQVADGKIWVWDYKPNAKQEKFAVTQTYVYALMLSKRTKIPLKNFMCGYFDEKNTYTFEPAKIKVSTITQV